MISHLIPPTLSNIGSIIVNNGSSDKNNRDFCIIIYIYKIFQNLKKVKMSKTKKGRKILIQYFGYLILKYTDRNYYKLKFLTKFPAAENGSSFKNI